MQQLGHTELITASEFFNNGSEAIPTWYRSLLFRARGHTASQAIPELSLAPRPFIAAEEGVEGQANPILITREGDISSNK